MRFTTEIGAVVAGSALLAALPACSSTPRHHVCTYAANPLTIDGRLDDAAWQKARWTEDFVDIVGPDRPAPSWRTRAKLLWDEKHLYIGAELEEPHVVATLTQHDAIVFHDNDFEVFIDPDDDACNYFEIEINVHNTVFDLLLVRTYRQGGPARHDWDVAGLRSAIHVEGTLNEPGDVDRGWSAELAIPWSALDEHAGTACPPAPGDRWRMNFSRVQWQYQATDSGYLKRPDRPEDNWVWSPQGEVNMHIPQRWGYVEFRGAGRR